ncbi:MAG: DUF58 domain-containing protein [Bacteroidia bacterium]|nr:DUF58 domain-containing protein [Bacteroidia bacterium]
MPSLTDKTTDLLQRVRRLEIKTRELSRQMFSGGYHSAFKGKGMSFSEVREYSIGDDVRSIDWNVSARTMDPHVKVFEEEREISVMLVVDVSASTVFGTQAGADGRLQLKQEWLAEIGAVLAFSAISNQDKVGAILFTDSVEHFVPPQKGKNHVLRIIRELLEPSAASSGTDIADALRHLSNYLKKRSIVFLLSDFYQDPATYQDALNLARRRHDVIGIHLYDPLEARLPKVGLLRVQDPETGSHRLIDTNEAALREEYERSFQTRLSSTKEAFRRSGADFLSLSVEDSYIQALMKFFSQRGARR